MAGFAHLHVASGFSMRYGASMPDAPRRARRRARPAARSRSPTATGSTARSGSPRRAAGPASRRCSASTSPSSRSSGLGARRHAPGGCRCGPDAGRPRPRRAPRCAAARIVDPRRPRVTVLARGRGGGTAPGVGWAALCRLVTETHLRGERGVPVTSPDLLAAGPPAPDPCDCARFSQPDGPADAADGVRHRCGRRAEPARSCCSAPTPTSAGRCSPGAASGPATCSRAWRALLPRDGARRRGRAATAARRAPPAAVGHAARLLALARRRRRARRAHRRGAPRRPRQDAATVDVLDAARRLVALDSRHLDRVTDAGHLADTAAMHAIALEVTGRRPAAAGADRELARD